MCAASNVDNSSLFNIRSRVGTPCPKGYHSWEECMEEYLNNTHLGIAFFESIIAKLQHPPSDEEWREILYSAVQNDASELVSFLLDKGVDQNIPTNNLGYIPITHAIFSRNVPMCILLLKAGANLYHKIWTNKSGYELLEDWFEDASEENRNKILSLFELDAVLLMKEPCD